MSYFSQKLVTVFMGVIFFIVPSVVTLVFGFPVFTPLVFLVLSILLVASQLSKIRKYQTHDYEWYKDTYPRFVNHGRLACYSCQGARVHVRGLLQGTYTREHFCTQCGKTLYYSQENK